MPKLTETLVRRLAHSKEGTVKHWDSEVKGLVLFVGKKAKTWYFQKDVGGKTRRVLIGRYPMISAAAARQTAMLFSLEWGRGAGKQIQLGAPSLKEAMEAYLARPNLRSEAHRKVLRQQFELHLKDWMRLPLDEITKSMVVSRHRSLATTPSSANHTLKYFRTVWNHARRLYDLPEAPTLAIEWYDERPDGSVIENLTDWRRTISNLENPVHAAFYEFILFTGLRKSEAFTLTWKNVHEDRVHLPMTKNGRSFDLPVVACHQAILAPLRGRSPDWVFPSGKSRSGHLTGSARIAWSPHAHRRTFATVAMEAGVLEEVVGRLLNHTPLSITGQRYARPSMDALPGRKVRRTAEPAWEQELATKHGRRCNPHDNGSSRVLGHFELNWPACLALDDRHAVSNCVGNDEIGHLWANKITSPKLAVDGEVEEHKVALVPGEFEPRTNCPDLSW